MSLEYAGGWNTSIPYQLRLGTDHVGLRGYAVDADEAEELLADRLRRSIAEVVRWRFAQWEKTPNLKASYSTGQAGKGATYRDDAEDRFPPGFGTRLRMFDARPTPWVA